MKQIKFILLSLFILGLAATASATDIETNGDASAAVNSAWLEFDQIENEKDGMKMHLDLSINNCKDQEVNIYIFIKESASGNWLKGAKEEYCNADGTLFIEKTIKPKFDNSHYKDLSVFIPLEAMEFKPGDNNYYCVAFIYYANESLAFSKGVEFSGTGEDPNENTTADNAPATTTSSNTSASQNTGNTSASAVTATINDTWLEHDVTEGGKKGFKVHMDVSLKNCGGKTAQIAVFIKDANGKYVDALKSEYSTPKGSLCISKQVSPKYDNSRFKDFPIFIPNEAFENVSGVAYSCIAYVNYGSKYIAKSSILGFTGSGSKPVSAPTNEIIVVKDNNPNLATIDWQNPQTESTNGSYELKADVNSKSKILGINVKFNGQTFKAVINNDHNIFLNNMLKLKDGINTIKIEVTNEAGTSYLEKSVYYYKSAKPVN